MGTNFYLYKDICIHCGRADPPKHIGKSSGGWCFALHVYPEEGIRDLDNWIALLEDPKATIKDEYGNKVSAEAMKLTITDRGWKETKIPFGYGSWEDFHQQNNSVPGPRYLARSKIDGQRCIGHGRGTWDLMVGEFG